MQDKKLIKKLVTHDGSFHTDDIFAAAALSIYLEKKGEVFEIIRIRDPKVIQNGDYVFDVGGIYDEKQNRFDHHQLGGAGKRDNGIEYASFGLVWKKFGKTICGGEEVKEQMDKILVEQVDANDNGINLFKPLTTHIFNYDISSVVSSFRSTWGERNSSKFFKNAVEFAKHILKKEIKQLNSLQKVKKLINQEYKKSKNKKLLILDINIPRYLAGIATSEYKNLLFLVFRDEKLWKVLTVRKATGTFGNKKNLPKPWAGLRDKDLQKVTGVKDAIFCHRALYMAVAKSKEGAIKLAKLALLEPIH